MEGNTITYEISDMFFILEKPVYNLEQTLGNQYKTTKAKI